MSAPSRRGGNSGTKRVGREVALSHLCALDATPAELVGLAHDHGFDSVGALRIVPTTDGRGHSLIGRPELARETAHRLADTGVGILDIEVFKLDEKGASAALPLLEIGGALGARHLLTMVTDNDPARIRDSVTELAQLAHDFGVVPVVEFMIFSGVPDLRSALTATSATPPERAGVLVDALHLARSGGTPQDLRNIEPRRLPYLQINDAADTAPARNPDAALREAVSRRLPPGDGNLPLLELLDIVPGVPVSVEAPAPPGVDPAAWVARLANSTNRLLEESSTNQEAP